MPEKPAYPPMTVLDDWETAMRSQRLSRRTIDERRRFLNKLATWLGDVPVETADVDQITRFMDEVNPREDTSSATYQRHLRAFYTWLEFSGRRADNPYKKIKIPAAKSQRATRAVTPAEYERLLATSMPRRTRMMVLLAGKQALRCVEIARIRGEDLNRTAMTLHVLGKGNQHDEIPLSRDVLAESIRLGFPDRGLWFPSHTNQGKPISAKAVSDTGRETLHRNGIAGGLHALRHMVGRKLVEEEVNLRVVQDMLRHKSITNTQRYTKGTEKQLRAAVDLL